MALATVQELQAYIKVANAGDEALLTDLLEGSSLFIERITGRQFHPEPETDDEDAVAKTFSTHGQEFVTVPDLREIESATLGGAEIDAYTESAGSGYVISGTLPTPSLWLSGLDYPTLTRNDLVITGYWGFSPVPADIKDACLRLAARGYKERAAGFSDSVSDAEGGLLSYFRQLPAFVQAVVNSYRLPYVA